MLVDLRPRASHGKRRSRDLDEAGITVNKNGIPFDTEPITSQRHPHRHSGRDHPRMKEEEMMEIAELMHAALEDRNDQTKVAAVRMEVTRLTSRFPLP